MKLEVGNFYKNVKGDVIKIVQFNERRFSFPFYDEEGYCYNENGGYGGYDGFGQSEDDLVEEVKAEKPTPEEVKEPTLLAPKGRALQYRTSKDGVWADLHTCAGDFEYRVKPSRETVVEYTSVLSTGYSLLPRKILKHQTGSPRTAVLKITTTFTGDKPNLPTVEVISHEDALKLEEQNEVAK